MFPPPINVAINVIVGKRLGCCPAQMSLRVTQNFELNRRPRLPPAVYRPVSTIRSKNTFDRSIRTTRRCLVESERAAAQFQGNLKCSYFMHCSTQTTSGDNEEFPEDCSRRFRAAK